MKRFFDSTDAEPVKRSCLGRRHPIGRTDESFGTKKADRTGQYGQIYQPDRGRRLPPSAVPLIPGSLNRHDFQEIYSLMDTPPCDFDCGNLCGKKCCQEYQPGVGMYLLPGEECMFTGNEPWLSWSYFNAPSLDFPESWKGYVPFLTCNGTCPREKRPIQCRTFPLMPYLDLRGNLSVRLDELNGILLCPLVKEKNNHSLRKEFWQRVLAAWEILIKDPLIRDDVEFQSRQLDEDLKSPWRKLL